MAPDALSEDEAEAMRETIRKARTQVGFTNQDLADELGWGVRSVTSALDSGRRLPATKAAAILRALLRAKPSRAPRTETPLRKGAVAKALGNALASLPCTPAALIPRWGLGLLADYLADEIARKPGSGPSHRNMIARELDRVLKKSCAALAFAAGQVYWSHLVLDADEAWDLRDELLRAFGYSPKSRQNSAAEVSIQSNKRSRKAVRGGK